MSPRFTILAITVILSFILDIFLEIKIVNILGMSVTSGIFVFPLCYIADDCITEVYGYKMSRWVMWMTFISALIAISILQLSCILPSYYDRSIDVSYDAIFSCSPRIFIASMLSLITGSTINSIVLSKMKVLSNGKGFRLRAILSSVFGRAGEVQVFYFCAFLGTMPIYDILSISFHTWLFGILYELCILPVTVKVADYLKRKDNMDAFDYDISYNPFSIKL